MIVRHVAPTYQDEIILVERQGASGKWQALRYAPESIGLDFARTQSCGCYRATIDRRGIRRVELFRIINSPHNRQIIFG